MLDAAVVDVPMELGLELRTVVGLDPLDMERQLLEHVVDELNRALLPQPVVDAEHPQAGAVVQFPRDSA